MDVRPARTAPRRAMARRLPSRRLRRGDVRAVHHPDPSENRRGGGAQPMMSIATNHYRRCPSAVWMVLVLLACAVPCFAQDAPVVSPILSSPLGLDSGEL